MPDEPQSPTRQFAANVKRYRTRRGWTQPQLSKRCREAGLDWDRSIVANVEAGRRASVSLQEILTVAYVFDVPPILMIFPLGLVEETEVLPGRSTDTWEAARWFTGEAPVPMDWVRVEYGLSLDDSRETVVDGERLIDHVQRRRDAYITGAAPVELFRRHDLAMGHYESLLDLPDFMETAQGTRDSAPAPDLQRIGETALRELRVIRAEMRRHGLRPPRLPENMAHVDDERFAYMTPAEAESLLRDHGVELRPVVGPRRRPESESTYGGKDEPEA